MSEEKHPFIKLSEIIEEYESKRTSFDADGLQDIRERIALLLFHLSDSASRAMSQQESADFNRKRNYAECFENWHNETDMQTGKKYTVAAAENKARIDNKVFEEEYVEATRKQQRVRIILSSTQQILNSIASRLNNIQKING